MLNNKQNFITPHSFYIFFCFDNKNLAFCLYINDILNMFFFKSYMNSSMSSKLYKNKRYLFLYKSKKMKIKGKTAYSLKTNKKSLVVFARNYKLPNNNIKKITAIKILFLKRRLGLLKFKHDAKKHNLYKASYRLDFKKMVFSKPSLRVVSSLNKQKRARKWLYKYYSVSKKTFTRVSMKNLRNTVAGYSKYNCIRQKKKTKIFFCWKQFK